MKKKLLASCLIFGLFLCQPVIPATAAIKEGKTCKEAGLTKVVSGKNLICNRQGKKLVWSVNKSNPRSSKTQDLQSVPSKGTNVVKVTSDPNGKTCLLSGIIVQFKDKTFACRGSTSKKTWVEVEISDAQNTLKMPISGNLEFFSWWTAGREAKGLQSVTQLFVRENPNAKFVNSANSASPGVNTKGALVSRLQAGNPPDSFQAHAGSELSSYIQAELLEDLTFLYKREGWDKLFPSDLIKTITVKGKIYSVPVTVYRTNLIWWNPVTAKKAGITYPPETIDELIADLEKFKSIGITGIALSGEGDWAIAQLFDAVLLGSLGAEKYEGLFSGSTSWKGPEVASAIENFQRILSYGNSSKTLNWPQASQLVVSGQAGYVVMGDWVSPQWQDFGFEPGVDFAWAPSPGTNGIFQWAAESFTLPKGAKNRDAGIAWLTILGSLEAQYAYNLEQGLTPVRTDFDSINYDAYQKSAMADWKSQRLVGSTIHGVNYGSAGMAAFNSVVGKYYQDGAKDNSGLAQGLYTAFRKNKS